jgi:hypothetical protein
VPGTHQRRGWREKFIEAMVLAQGMRLMKEHDDD